MNNYEADRAMSHKRIRMEGEGGPGVVQSNGLPLNYMDNGHQIPPYQPYASAYNTHYPPEAFSAYGGPPPGSYAPQNLSYVPPAHQNYPPPPHHQPFASQQASLHMTHNMAAAYDQGHHKVSSAWPPQATQVPQAPPQQAQPAAMMPKPIKPPQPEPIKVPQNPAAPQVKPEVKMEPQEVQRPKENLEMQADHDAPKIKIKTDLYQQDEAKHSEVEGAASQIGTTKLAEPSPANVNTVSETLPPAKPAEEAKTKEDLETVQPSMPQQQPSAASVTDNSINVPEGTANGSASRPENDTSLQLGDTTARTSDSGNSSDGTTKAGENFPGFSEDASPPSEDEPSIPNEIYFGTPDISTYRPKLTGPQTPIKTPPAIPGLEPKKRGRPKGSTNKPKPPSLPGSPNAATPNRILTPNTPGSILGSGIQAATPGKVGLSSLLPTQRVGVGRPRGSTAYQFAVRPFKRDFSGVTFKRRFSDDCLDSSNIPNEIYFGDVPVATEVLFNYYDANLEKEKQQAAAALAARAAAARLHQAKLELARKNSSNPNAVTTVDSSSDDSSDDSDSDSSDTNDDDNQPLKRRPGRPKGSKNRPSSEGKPPSVRPDGTPIKRGRPPVPPELRTPGITDMKKFLKAAGIRYDYKKLTDGCTKNKERVDRMKKLLDDAGLDGELTIDKCRALRKPPKSKTPKTPREPKEPKTGDDSTAPRRVTRGQTSDKPRQKIVISSDEDEETKIFLSRFKPKPKREIKKEKD